MVLTVQEKLIKFKYYTKLMNRYFENENLAVYALKRLGDCK